MKKCEACGEHIEEYDKIILTDDGEVYHEDCCDIYNRGYVVYVDECFVGETEDGATDAWVLLGKDQYKEVKE
ncbi:hypothetical protein [Jeotgalibaca porci]|uniref:hypothetical protein n=1 Tax=Jeotgalibaca porci TaxID=1868793 RepID=UPI00359FEC64